MGGKEGPQVRKCPQIGGKGWGQELWFGDKGPWNGDKGSPNWGQGLGTRALIWGQGS